MRALPTLRRLQLFEQLGHLLSFHRTAEAVGIAQPALTRAIRQLEEDVGFALFTRTTRRTQLTPVGQIFHLRVQQWLREMDSVIGDCQRLAQGANGQRLLLGYSAQASHSRMSQLLFQFGLRHARVDLNLRQLPSEVAYEEVAVGSLDGAFLIYDEEHLRRLALRSVPIEEQGLIALCAASHPLVGQAPVAVQALAQWGTVIGSQTRWQVFRKTVLLQLAVLGVTPRIVYEADDTPLLLEVISQSDHIGLYGSGIAHQLPAGLIALPLREQIHLPLCFAYAASGGSTVAALVHFLQQSVQDWRPNGFCESA